MNKVLWNRQECGEAVGLGQTNVCELIKTGESPLHADRYSGAHPVDRGRRPGGPAGSGTTRRHQTGHRSGPANPHPVTLTPAGHRTTPV